MTSVVNRIITCVAQEKIRCKAKAAADAKAAAGRANAAHLVQELPLPHGWEALVDSAGRLYYGNPSLKVTQYQHPGIYFSPEAEAATRAKAAAQAQPGAAAKPPPAGAGEKAFCVGAHVIVQGVTARPELNGRTGVCEALDATSGRWTIRFDVDNTLVKLQPKKLRALAQVLPPPVPLALFCPALTVFVFALRTMQQLPLIFRAHHPW